MWNKSQRINSSTAATFQLVSLHAAYPNTYPMHITKLKWLYCSEDGHFKLYLAQVLTQDFYNFKIIFYYVYIYIQNVT